MRQYQRGAPSALGFALLAATMAVGGCVPSAVLTVETQPTANNGRPFYMLVRAVDAKAFGKESYQEIAHRVVSPDDSVLSADVIFPGVLREVRLKPPSKSAMAVYFLFTEPSEPWQKLFDMPPSKVRIVLDRNRMKSVEGTGVRLPPAMPERQAPKAPAAK